MFSVHWTSTICHLLFFFFFSKLHKHYGYNHVPEVPNKPLLQTNKLFGPGRVGWTVFHGHNPHSIMRFIASKFLWFLCRFKKKKKPLENPFQPHFFPMRFFVCLFFWFFNWITLSEGNISSMHCQCGCFPTSLSHHCGVLLFSLQT